MVGSFYKLPYGLNSSMEIFQCTLSMLLTDIECLFVDVDIFTPNFTVHDDILAKVLELIISSGLK